MMVRRRNKEMGISYVVVVYVVLDLLIVKGYCSQCNGKPQVIQLSRGEKIKLNYWIGQENSKEVTSLPRIHFSREPQETNSVLYPVYSKSEPVRVTVAPRIPDYSTRTTTTTTISSTSGLENVALPTTTSATEDLSTVTDFNIATDLTTTTFDHSTESVEKSNETESGIDNALLREDNTTVIVELNQTTELVKDVFVSVGEDEVTNKTISDAAVADVNKTESIDISDSDNEVSTLSPIQTTSATTDSSQSQTEELTEESPKNNTHVEDNSENKENIFENLSTTEHLNEDYSTTSVTGTLFGENTSSEGTSNIQSENSTENVLDNSTENVLNNSTENVLGNSTEAFTMEPKSSEEHTSTGAPILEMRKHDDSNEDIFMVNFIETTELSQHTENISDIVITSESSTFKIDDQTTEHAVTSESSTLKIDDQTTEHAVTSESSTLKIDDQSTEHDVEFESGSLTTSEQGERSENILLTTEEPSSSVQPTTPDVATTISTENLSSTTMKVILSTDEPSKGVEHVIPEDNEGHEHLPTPLAVESFHESSVLSSSEDTEEAVSYFKTKPDSEETHDRDAIDVASTTTSEGSSTAITENNDKLVVQTDEPLNSVRSIELVTEAENLVTSTHSKGGLLRDNATELTEDDVSADLLEDEVTNGSHIDVTTTSNDALSDKMTEKFAELQSTTENVLDVNEINITLSDSKDSDGAESRSEPESSDSLEMSSATNTEILTSTEQVPVKELHLEEEDKPLSTPKVEQLIEKEEAFTVGTEKERIAVTEKLIEKEEAFTVGTEAKRTPVTEELIEKEEAFTVRTETERNAVTEDIIEKEEAFTVGSEKELVPVTEELIEKEEAFTVGTEKEIVPVTEELIEKEEAFTVGTETERTPVKEELIEKEEAFTVGAESEHIPVTEELIEKEEAFTVGTETERIPVKEELIQREEAFTVSSEKEIADRISQDDFRIQDGLTNDHHQNNNFFYKEPIRDFSVGISPEEFVPLKHNNNNFDIPLLISPQNQRFGSNDNQNSFYGFLKQSHQTDLQRRRDHPYKYPPMDSFNQGDFSVPIRSLMQPAEAQFGGRGDDSMPFMRQPRPQQRPGQGRFRRETDSGKDQATELSGTKCEWVFKTEPGVPLLLMFKNYSTLETPQCSNHHIAVEREGNGFESRWCGEAGDNPGHVTFARNEIRLRLYTESDGSVPTGFVAEVQALDINLLRRYTGFRQLIHGS